MSNSNSVHFFDIKSTLNDESRGWSPNTQKTRMVLKYKGIPFTQSFVSYPDIAPLLSQMAVPPHPEGFGPYQYTLPAISHPDSAASGSCRTLMDSLPIAVHLEAAFPSSPTIFPSGNASYALAIAVDKLMRNVAQAGITLVIPKVAEFLDPRGKEYFVRTRSATFGKPLAEVCPTAPEEVQKLVDKMKREIKPIIQMLEGKRGKTGPFFEGDKVGYADLILVAYMVWFERANKDVFQGLIEVGNGEVKTLWDLCQSYTSAEGEDQKWEIP